MSTCIRRNWLKVYRALNSHNHYRAMERYTIAYPSLHPWLDSSTESEIIDQFVTVSELWVEYSKATQLSPSSTSFNSHAVIFPYFSLILPRSYCMLILSFSQSSKSDNTLVLIELLTLRVLYRSERPGTIACGLYSDESHSMITTNQSLFASNYCEFCVVAVH